MKTGNRAAASTRQSEQVADDAIQTERLLAVGTLSSGIAHHFNNLLSIILGYSSHLINQENWNEDSRDALTKISEAAQKGRRLTEEMLAFVGSETEQQTDCSVHRMLSSLVPLLEHQVDRRVRVTLKLDATRDQVISQRSALHQTLYNLLTNSLDGVNGDAELIVQTSNIARSSAEEAPGQIKIEVIDTRQGPMLIEAPHPALVLALDETEKVPVPPPAQTRRLAANEIWVVDDDSIFCEMCSRVLSDDGHRVTAISSGPELQERWQSTATKPQLLIMDFSMPDYNGLELCTWLKEQGCRSPIILVSGFSPTHPDIDRALKMRKTFFLQKPFPVPELADIVSVALGETLLG